MTAILELAPSFAPRPNIAHVLFDFDGTLSLVRAGWADVMVDLFLDHLPNADAREIHDEIQSLTGHESIHQLARLTARLRAQGRSAHEPVVYKEEFLQRLEQTIDRRLSTKSAHDLLVSGSRELLELLTGNGLMLHLASGTDLNAVRREAEWLGITRFFGDRIHGPSSRSPAFSKRNVIADILRNHHITGDQLLAFGDGPVEIEETKSVGGLAVAVASDESNFGSGRIDPAKRQRLLAAGADAVIPDFRQAGSLLHRFRGD